jgi:hypothetical protein
MDRGLHHLEKKKKVLQSTAYLLPLASKTSFTEYPPSIYYWTVSLILNDSYLVGNLTNPKNVETKALEPLKS